MSCHLMSLMSPHLISSPLLASQFALAHFFSFPLLFSPPPLSFMSCHVTLSHLTSSHLLSCHVMSCRFMSCHAASPHLSSHLLSSHVMQVKPRLKRQRHRTVASSFHRARREQLSKRLLQVHLYPRRRLWLLQPLC